MRVDDLPLNIVRIILPFQVEEVEMGKTPTAFFLHKAKTNLQLLSLRITDVTRQSATGCC